MTRLSPHRINELAPDQAAVWESITGTRGDPDTLVGADGALIGPFNAMVASPTIGAQIAALGAAVRFRNSLEARLLEIVILTVGAHWRSNFEFWIHSGFARAAGVSEATISDLHQGDTPTLSDPREQQVWALTRELLESGRVTELTWSSVVDHVDERAAVDLIATIGYYSLICLMLNALEIEVPPGERPPWPD